MKALLLESASQLDDEKECGLSYLTSIENCYSELHYHDFYELLLITEGKLMNEVNGVQTVLEKGTLVFFRPEDVHQLKQYKNFDCRFINLTFLARTVQDLWTYMGEELSTSKFAASPLPPCLFLSEGQMEKVAAMMNSLNTIPATDKRLIRTTLRMSLTDLYFKLLPLAWVQDDRVMPGWLYKLCSDIKQKENFILGTRALLDLSGKNPSYLCRAFKKYLNTTPTEYINRLRLDYAENLLLNSDISITGICYETGFESLSHFYRLFEERFGLTPMKYRKKHWNSIHRWK